MQLAQQGADEDKNCARVAARVDELEGLIGGNKDLVRYHFDTRLKLALGYRHCISIPFHRANDLR